MAPEALSIWMLCDAIWGIFSNIKSWRIKVLQCILKGPKNCCSRIFYNEWGKYRRGGGRWLHWPYPLSSYHSPLPLFSPSLSSRTTHPILGSSSSRSSSKDHPTLPPTCCTFCYQLVNHHILTSAKSVGSKKQLHIGKFLIKWIKHLWEKKLIKNRRNKR